MATPETAPPRHAQGEVRAAGSSGAERPDVARIFPVPFRGGGFVSRRHPVLSIVFFISLIGVWEAAVETGVIARVHLPSPSDIVDAFYTLFATGLIWNHLSNSLFRISLGWSLGTVAGLAMGFSIGIWSHFRAVGVPVVSALFPVPKIALLPLLILWLGIGETSKVATIALGVFFPTAIATYSGVDGVPRNLIRMAQSFNLPPRAILTKVILPGALPSILSGFRITASIALILLVAAEMIGAEYGIGAFILSSGNLYQTDQLLAGVVMLSVLGLVIGTGLSRLEAWLLKWR